ncbi:MAG: energy-coupling factor transporter transmembrane component T family protein [Candidatus Thorarchaeota archaeon]
MSSAMNYTESDSFLHRLNPLLKFLSLLITSISILINPNLLLGIFLLGTVLLLFVAAKEHPQLSRRRIRFLVIFSILLFVLQVLITTNGTILFFLLPSIEGSLPLFPITTFGIERGLIISTRFLLIVFSSMLFVAVTDPTLLAYSLARVRIPYRYAYTLVIALRFLPLFDMENQVVRMAQRSRGLSTNVRSLRSIMRTVRFTFFPLLVSALSRVDELSISMDGRGFGSSDQRNYYRQAHWRWIDSLLLVLMLSFLLFSILSAIGAIPFFSL